MGDVGTVPWSEGEGGAGLGGLGVGGQRGLIDSAGL